MSRGLAIVALAASGCLLDFDARLVQHEEVCGRDGVIRCYGFEDETDIVQRFGEEFVTDPLCEDGQCWRVDPDTFVSGTGSLRFEIASGSEGPPTFQLNFTDDLSVHVGEGEDLYVQWRQRFTPDILRQYVGRDGFEIAEGWLQAQLGPGDRDGNVTDSCSEIDVGVGQHTGFQGPTMWVNCDDTTPLEDFLESDVRIQTGADAPCLYNNDNPTSPPCVAYPADRWTAYQIHVAIGTWGAGDSHVRMWMAEPGEGRRMVFDSEGVQLNGGAGEAFGKVWFGPLMYRRDPSEDHPPGYTWVDNLVVSRSEIPDPEL